MGTKEELMTFVTVDGDMVAKLNGLADLLVFRDEKGNVLGKFQPDENSPLVREWLRTVKPTISDEEMQRRATAGDGITTQELLSRLKDRK
jgi:hypothetical protein